MTDATETDPQTDQVPRLPAVLPDVQPIELDQIEDGTEAGDGR